MFTPVSVFLDFNLPNATTWLYFSFLLAVALFFKFGRLLSARNLDIVLLFLLVPGLLVVQAMRSHPQVVEKQATQVAATVGHAAMPNSSLPTAVPLSRFVLETGPALEAPRWLWYGYLWIILGSMCFFGRCVLDLALVQRPALTPNLQPGGLAWLAGALMVCMVAVAYRQIERHSVAGNGADVLTPALAPFEPQDQPMFAITILWQDWPAWALAALAFAGHFTVLACLLAIGWMHFQDQAAGMAAATFYLLLPYTGLQVGQLHHVLPMALFLGAIVAYRYPTLSGLYLGISAASTYFPIFVLPLWLSFYRGAGLGRFLIAFAIALAAGLGTLALILAEYEELESSIALARTYAAWQPWIIPTSESLWTGIGLHWAYRVPVFVLFLILVGVTMFWPAPKNLAHLIALSAAIFIAMQWWCADQGGAYVLWYLPLLLLMVFRPNLQDRAAPPIVAETDWLTRSLQRLLRRPQPTETPKV